MTQPTRPYDALYDSTFTVAGPRDHYRQQTLGGGFNIERAPVYNNFFSELPHYPPSTLRLKNADRVPGFIDRNYHPQPKDPSDLAQRSKALAVSGAERPKYFRRPLLAAAEIHVKQSLPPLPQYQDLNATAPAAMSATAPEPRSKTIGTQSDYRENEAQTAPWEPGFVLPERPSVKQQALSKRYHCDGPEVLHLRDMMFADGLPAGLQEVTRIDKMRAKRAFEATLPPIDDAARLPLRQKMIEEWEAKEWEEREQEILGIQEQRLGLLENALQVREEEVDEEHRARVEERKKATLAARAGKFADVQATRIKTMRQLIENRKYVEKHRKLHKPTIVERYANFGSSTYAPLQREGRFPESKPMGKEIETEGYEPVTLKGVMDLEAFLPASMLNPKVSAPKRPHRLDFAGRKEAAVQRDLKAINDLLDASKATAGRGHGECWPAPLKDDGTGLGLGSSGGVGGMSLKRVSSSLGGARQALGSASGAAGGGAIPPLLPPAGGSNSLVPVLSAGGSPSAATRRPVRAVERPPTPELPQPPALLQPQHAALVLLQRLLRGRAAQNVMYEGRLRRQELIDELRLAERVSPDGSKLDGKPIRRPDDRDAATLRVDALLGSVVSEVCVVLSETDAAKREILLAGLGSSAAHAAAATVAAAVADISAASAAAAEAAAAAAAALAAEAAAAAAKPPPPSLPMESTWGAQPEEALPPQAEAPASAAAARPNSASAAAAAAANGGSGAVNLEALGISPEEAEQAALRIQAAFQGHRARKEVAAMRARGELLRRVMEEGNEHKVVVCQAAIRGYLDRKRVREMKAARAAAAAAAAAAAEAGEDEAPPHVEDADADASPAVDAKPSAEELYDLSSYTDEQIEAVTRIQAAQRGFMARKRVAAIRAAREQGLDGDTDAAGPTEMEAEPEPEMQPSEAADAATPSASASAAALHSDYTVEQEVAVIRIQAAGRGFLARRRVAAMRAGEAGLGGDNGEGAEAAPRHRVIGRHGVAAAAEGEDAGDGEMAAEGEAGEGEAGDAAAGADGQEAEELWPKMKNLSGFVLAPAAERSQAEVAGLPEGEAEADGQGGEASAAALGDEGGEASAAPEPEATEAEAEPQAEATEAEPQAEAEATEAGPEASLAGVGSAAAEGEAEPEASLADGSGPVPEAEAEVSLAAGGSTPAEGEVSLMGAGYGDGEAAREEGDTPAEAEASLAAGQGEGEAAFGEGEGGEASAAAMGDEDGGEEGARAAEAEGYGEQQEGEEGVGETAVEAEASPGEEAAGEAGEDEGGEDGRDGGGEDGEAGMAEGEEAGDAGGEASQGWAEAGQEGGEAEAEGEEGPAGEEAAGEEGGDYGAEADGGDGGDEGAGWEEGGEGEQGEDA